MTEIVQNSSLENYLLPFIQQAVKANNQIILWQDTNSLLDWLIRGPPKPLLNLEKAYSSVNDKA